MFYKDFMNTRISQSAHPSLMSAISCELPMPIYMKNRNKSFLILKGYFKMFLSKEMKSCEGNLEEAHPHKNSESSIAGTITE